MSISCKGSIEDHSFESFRAEILPPPFNTLSIVADVRMMRGQPGERLYQFDLSLNKVLHLNHGLVHHRYTL